MCVPVFSVVSNSLQSMDYSLLGSSVHGIFQTRILAASAAKSLHLCPTLCDPIDGSPPDSPVPGVLQARTLEWVAISFSNVWQWKVKVKSLRHVQLLATPWTVAHQTPLSVGFSRQEYWSGVPLPTPKDPLTPAWSRCCYDMEETTYLETLVQILPQALTSWGVSQRVT